MAGAICSTIAYCQIASNDVVAAAGDYFRSTNYNMSWTIGECITETYVSGENILNQGFQQSTYVITAVQQFALNGITVKAFPNPTTNFINVSIETTVINGGVYVLELFDAQGKLLLTDKLNEKQGQLDMSGFIKGTYLLSVSNQDCTKRQTFKIEKN